jgi:hypothetical protein
VAPTTLSAEQLAAQLRAVGKVGRELAGDLQYASWSGAPAADAAIANLCRGAEGVEAAARTIAGKALPHLPGRLTVATVLSIPLAVAVFGAILAAVPDPGRPAVMVMATLGAWFAVDGLLRANRAWDIRHRPPQAVSTSGGPAAIEPKVQEIQDRLDAMLETIKLDRHAAQRDAVDQIRIAREWFGMAIEPPANPS